MSVDRQPLTSERFTEYYAQPKATWDIGRPQTPFVAAADRIGPRVLDIGCGTGDLAIWLAEQGRAVTGIDFIEPPLAVARQKAAERGAAITFLRMDALAVGEIPERFDAVTDCGLFHTFDDAGRAAYVRGLARLLESGSRLFLLCMSTAEPGAHGPRRVGEAELRATFHSGWEIETLEPTRFEVVPGIPGAEFSPGGAHAWFAVIRRV
jgi:2-polyprenyl-3-methyl-5-hydroxy-6-metoxy-1,4-benzoquinol methylase